MPQTIEEYYKNFKPYTGPLWQCLKCKGKNHPKERFCFYCLAKPDTGEKATWEEVYQMPDEYQLKWQKEQEDKEQSDGEATADTPVGGPT